MLVCANPQADLNIPKRPYYEVKEERKVREFLMAGAQPPQKAQSGAFKESEGHVVIKSPIGQNGHGQLVAGLALAHVPLPAQDTRASQPRGGLIEKRGSGFKAPITTERRRGKRHTAEGAKGAADNTKTCRSERNVIHSISRSR